MHWRYRPIRRFDNFDSFISPQKYDSKNMEKQDSTKLN